MRKITLEDYKGAERQLELECQARLHHPRDRLRRGDDRADRLGVRWVGKTIADRQTRVEQRAAAAHPTRWKEAITGRFLVTWMLTDLLGQRRTPYILALALLTGGSHLDYPSWSDTSSGGFLTNTGHGA